MISTVQNKKSTLRLAEFIVEQDLVSQENMLGILEDISGLNVDLPFVLHKRGLVDEERVALALSEVFELPLIKEVNPDEVLTTVNLLPISDMDQFRILPIRYRVEQQRCELEIMTANPFTIIDWMPAHAQVCLHIQISTSSEIKRGLAHALEKQTRLNIHQQIIDQLLVSKMITHAQIEFAKQQVLKRPGNRSAISESNSSAEIRS